jgi:5,6-dimethylbenzimidazole synthase
VEVYEAIEKRRTIRAFTKPATEETLRKIILAGAHAPSPDNRQPWEFIIIDKPELIEKIAEHKYRQNQKVYTESVALAQKKAYRNCAVVAACYKDQPGSHWCAWMAVQNMALAATAEGLGIVPSTLWGEDQAAVEKLLGLPEGYKLATMVLVGVQKGYPRFPKVPRRPEFGWLHRNRFGTPAFRQAA